MSWPTDGKPRYSIARTTGYLAPMKGTPGGKSEALKQPCTVAVLDRAFCHRTIAVYRTEGIGGTILARIAKAEALAHKKIAALNAEMGAVAA